MKHIHEIRRRRFGTGRLLAVAGAMTVAAMSSVAQAAVIFWQGGNGTSWNTAANWSPAQVPGSGDYVIFKNNANSFVVNLGGHQTIDTFEIEANATNGYSFIGGSFTLESGTLKSGGNQSHTINCDAEFQTQGYCLVGSNGTMTINNPVTQSNSTGFLKGWTGTLRLNALNTLSGDISISSGTIALGHDEGLRSNTVLINANGALSVSNTDSIIGAIGGAGTIDMGSAVRIRFGENNASTTFSGLITGAGQLVKQGGGVMVIESDLPDYDGTIKISDGTLAVNGNLDRPVFVDTNGKLTGSGSVGTLTQQGVWNGGDAPVVSPGDGVGTLAINGWCQLIGRTQFEIGGTTPGLEHDQIIVSGYADTVNYIDVSYVNGFVASPGDEFVILQAGTLDSDRWVTTWNGATLPDDQPWYFAYDGDAGTVTLKICPNGGDCNNNGIGDDCEPDRDSDGIIDDCDICDDGPNDQDADGDGVPDACDVCPGFDDNGPNADGDWLPDACDPCFGNHFSGDDDNDGVCNNRDNCPGFDDNLDADGDGVPDDCDQCLGDDATGDADGDGKCDDLDNCPGEDDFGPDADGDGLADVCDFCDGSDTGDLDDDGDVDALDFDGFDVCLTGPAIAAGLICDCYDIEPNNEVNIRDYAFFQRAFTGPAFVEEAPGEINIQNIFNGLSDKGVAFFGENPNDYAGYSVALLGDINGDGYGEMMVGAPSYGTGDFEHAGRVYVVYGGPDPKNILLENLTTGIGGFAIDGTGGFDHPYLTREIGESTAYPGNYEPFEEGGPQGEGAGFDVAAAGDINGDGVPDMIISAPYGVANGQIWGGRTYVVFGDAPVDGSIPLNFNALTLSGQSTGFMIEGERGICPTCPGNYIGIQNGDLFGWAADGARDVNGDGLADILVSAKNHGDVDQGRAYSIFGKSDDAPVDLSTMGGVTGPGVLFDMVDVTDLESMGYRLCNVSDYNGDGLTDYMVAPAIWGTTTYIANGRTAPGTITLTNANHVDNVTVIRGGSYQCEFGEDEETGELLDYCIGRYGASLPDGGGGDFNGDAKPDFVRMIANYSLQQMEILVFFNNDSDLQRVFTTFGTAESPLDPPNGGVRIYTENVTSSGWKNEVTLNSDVNGDGYDDVVLGMGVSTGPGKRTTYIIFGGPDSRSVNLDTLLEDGNGIKVIGGVNGSRPGFVVDTSGDVNGDGLNDILIGDPGNDHLGQDAGAVYLVYGDDFNGSITHMGDESANTLTGTSNADAMVGGRGDDVMIGNGGADTMYAGAGDDRMIVSDAGFHRIRGGAGFDTLAVEGNIGIDLEAARGRIDEIEQIDLSAAGADSATVTRIDLFNLSPTSNQLFIRGTAEDEVISRGERWSNEGTFDVGGTAFVKFVDGRAELFVQDGIQLRFGPVILTESIAMFENTAVDSSIGIVDAVDPDGGQIVDFAITGGDGQNLFAIDSGTGQITVTGAIDFEQLSPANLALDVQVTDDLGEIDLVTITIVVQDVNEAPTWTVQNQLFTTLSEHAQTGLTVGNFTAIDVDGGDAVSYGIDLNDATLTSPTYPGAFAIDSMSGELTVANGALLDHEMQVVHEMIVYAEDLGGLRSPSILVSFTLIDVQAWSQRFSGIFETTGASTWSTDNAVEATPIMFEKDVDFDGTGSESVSLLGVDLTVEAAGQIHFESAIATDSGSVDATIPFAAEISIPDEVALGQPFTIGLNLLDPLASPTMSGTTPSADVDMLIEYTNLEVQSTVNDFGPYNGSNSSDEYLTSSVGQDWTAGVQPDGSLATNSTVSTKLLELTEIDWDSYLENFLSLANFPSNEGMLNGLDFGTIRINTSYVLWGLTMTGAVTVDQDYSLDVDGYTAVIVFENGSSQSITVDGDTTITLPIGADTNGDGFADYEVRVDIDTTFTNNSDYFGTITKNVQMGYFHFQGFTPSCGSCGVQTAEIGPVVDLSVNVDVFTNDATGPFPTPWTENEAGQFPLGGFNTVVFEGSIDLNG